MTKFSRTLATTTYTCKVYNRDTDALEIAKFVAEGKPVSGRALSKLVESESGFEAHNMHFLHVIETYTETSKYECTLEDFLKIAKKVEKLEDNTK